MFPPPGRRHRQPLLAPEVVQTSSMDCGPASLKCLLEGAGLPVSYARLREACETDVDGTSIDTLEVVANQLGLPVEQVVVPVDHLCEPETRAFPSLVVVRLPDGNTHFIALWRQFGPLVQLMDPACGRRWETLQALRRELYVHKAVVPAEAWREWAGEEEFLGPLRRRLVALLRSEAEAQQRLDAAVANPEWRGLATLDTAARMVESLVASGGLRPGHQAAEVLASVLEEPEDTLPDGYWLVRPAEPDEEGQPQLAFRGAVLLRLAQPEAGEAQPQEMSEEKPLPPELVAALREPVARPWRTLFGLLRAEGMLPLLMPVVALLLGCGAVVIEGVLLRSLLEVGHWLKLGEQRLGALGAVVLFAVGLLLVELAASRELWRLGRALEVRFRVAFLQKVPLLGDRYFRSRQPSDMAERSHRMDSLQQLPPLLGQTLRLVFQLVATAGALIWLHPPGALAALIAVLSALLLPLLARRFLEDGDLRVRNHSGALGRFYLDAFLGLLPLRAHGAGRALRREHESLLHEWGRAGAGLLRLEVLLEGVQSAVGLGLAAWLVLSLVEREGPAGRVLLVAYWALSLPVLGQGVARLARQQVWLRNITLRLMEPLTTPVPERASAGSSGPREEGPVSLRLEGVGVRASGHTLLEPVDLELGAGEQVAIVGPSGAGKSSLVGLLLGWHAPSGGRLLVDGEPLDEARLEWLRERTAWVDPQVQLWNRSLLENLAYGSEAGVTRLGEVVSAADLRPLVGRLPEGMRTSLGEGGALVSGGEGQRVRLGRALAREKPRLVILDEPFRGLDRAQRAELMRRARELWRGCTLLCITHDVGETLGFERVLVMEAGRLVEDGAPGELAARPDSRFRALLEAETEVRTALWSAASWRRLRVVDGQVVEEEREAS